MKKLVLLLTIILTMILLTACGGKAYKEALDKGYSALKEKNYEEAYDNFVQAWEHKEKKEAKKGKETADTMRNGWEAYDEGEWDEALELALTIIEDDSDDHSIKIVKDDAQKLHDKAEELKKEEKEILKLLDDIDHFITENDLVEADKLLQQLLAMESNHDVIVGLLKEGNSLEEKLDKLKQEKEESNDKKDLEDKNSPVEEEKENNDSENQDRNNEVNENDKNEQTDEEISVQDAENILREQLSLPEDVTVELDRTEGNHYIMHVYHVVVFDEEHAQTSTWGWYEVNKETGEWADMFND